MISNQILQSTIEGLKGIARIDLCVLDAEGKVLASIEKSAEVRAAAGDRALLRAIHFVTENVRVQKEVEALKNDDFAEFLRVLKASGDSSYKFLQNVYTNHDVQHQNVSVALAISETILGENGACRVHGGGFAGTIQAFVPLGKVNEYKTKMENVFGENSCYQMKIRPVGGIEVL